MSYASRTNLALGGAIVSAVLAQAFPQFTLAWLILGGLSSVVAVHALFSDRATTSNTAQASDAAVTADEVIKAESARSEASHMASQSDLNAYSREVLKLKTYRALMSHAAALQSSGDADSLPMWSRALRIRSETMIAANAAFLEFQLRGDDLMDLSRAAALDSAVASSGRLVVKRHVRSSMLDEQLVNWMRHIDEPDQSRDLKHTFGAKKRSETGSVMVPNFSGSALLH
ncbi:hypothetical protein [Achromobacter anxifer]|uniref:hypothetical protein n=1 Tax=Achromobacter anxifer TaxID=1287737 RepID=UPI0021585122|nr:hypothetical protein [Achromobacter anxifer]